MSPSKLNHREHGMSGRGPILRAGACVLVVLAATALAIAPALATENATSQKMLRQIGVMEKIIDKVLVDSPNVLVSGMGNTRGLYVDPFGVVFTFTASILRGDSPLARLSDWSFSTKDDQYDVTTDKDGNQVITIKKGKKDKTKQSEAGFLGRHREGPRGGMADRAAKEVLAGEGGVGPGAPRLRRDHDLPQDRPVRADRRIPEG